MLRHYVLQTVQICGGSGVDCACEQRVSTDGARPPLTLPQQAAEVSTERSYTYGISISSRANSSVAFNEAPTHNPSHPSPSDRSSTKKAEADVDEAAVEAAVQEAKLAAQMARAARGVAVPPSTGGSDAKDRRALSSVCYWGLKADAMLSSAPANEPDDSHPESPLRSPRCRSAHAQMATMRASMLCLAAYSGVGTRGSPPSLQHGVAVRRASGLLTCAHKVATTRRSCGAPLQRAPVLTEEVQTVMARAPPMMRPPPALPKMRAPSTRRPRHRSAPAGRAPRRTEEPARPNLRSGTSNEDRQQDGERDAVREHAGRVRASRSRHNQPSTSPRDPSLPIRRQRPDLGRRDASPPVARVRVQTGESELVI